MISDNVMCNGYQGRQPYLREIAVISGRMSGVARRAKRDSAIKKIKQHGLSPALDSFCAWHAECIRARNRARYAANTERFRSKSRQYREENPGFYRAYYAANIERERARGVVYRAKNPERARERGRAKYAALSDIQRARKIARVSALRAAHPERTWAKRNPERAREISRNSARARRAATPELIRKRNADWCRAKKRAENSQAILLSLIEATASVKLTSNPIP